MGLQYKELKEGTYLGRALSWDFHRANTGSRGLFVNFAVLPPDFPDSDPTPPDALHMQHVFYFTEGSLDIAMRALTALGAWDPKADEATRQAVMAELVNGRGALPNEVDLVIGPETRAITDHGTNVSKNVTTTKIKFVNAKGSGNGLTASGGTDAEKAEFVNLFASLMAKKKANAMAKGPLPGLANGSGPAAPAVARPSDDDLPF